MGSPMETMNLDLEAADLSKNLFKSAMKGEWDKVVAKYKDNPKSYGAPITRSGDTALHLAVRDGKDYIVEELVNLMNTANPDRAKEALKVANDKKNTALHLAAAVGNVRMCKSIAQLEPSLIGTRNEDGETPLFWAALHGNKDTFFCLHKICGPTQALSYYRRSSDGETILHVAIAGEYYDLAFQIIYFHEELSNAYNQKGITPLHILASKPNAFRSGTHLAGYHKMIYHCIFVEELKEGYTSTDAASNNDNNPRYPQNYKTCMNFLELTMEGFKFAMTLLSKLKLENLRHCLKSPPPPGDAENQRGNESKDGVRSRQLVPSKDGVAAGNKSKDGVRSRQLVPSNYDTCFDLVKFVSKAMLIVLGFGSSEIKKLRDKKEKHTWSVQVLDKLLQNKLYEYEYEYEYTHTGQSPHQVIFDDAPYSIGESGDANIKKENWEDQQEKENRDKVQGNLSQTAEKETPILIAAKNGIAEMVEKILEKFPVAIHDMNSEKKNVVLLAVENRQPHVYKLLLNRKVMKHSIFRRLDDKGNSALHLAAKIGDSTPWRIPGAALQMQWEIKWYEYVKNSMPAHFFIRHNNDNKTPKAIFNETHKELVKSGGDWLTNTSESCSVVAALIATVAFATAATVPGGVNQESGRPTLQKHPAFNAFAFSSVVALCFSVTSVVMFLAILTSRYEVRDFRTSLPIILLLGLTSLFMSIAAILVSFCTGHFFVLKDELKYAALPIYAVTCLPVTLFALAQFPLYIDLVWASFRKVPQRRYMAVH